MAAKLQVHLVLSALLLAVLGLGCRTVGPIRVPKEPEVRFHTDRPAALDTRTVVGPNGAGLTLVRPRIEGRDLGWFLLDSGASNLLISRRDSRRLGLPIVAEGFVDGRISVTYHHALGLELGPLSLHDVLVAAVDWSHAASLREALGRELAGLAGYQIFAHAVVEVRYGSGTRGDRVALHDPATYELPGGSWHPLRVIDRRPVVPVRLSLPGSSGGEPEEILVVVDTGTAGSLVLDAALAVRAGLVEELPGSTERDATEPIRLGARVRSLGSAAPWVELAGHRFEQVPVAVRPIPLGTRRALAEVDGIVGRQLFRGLTLILDLAHHRIAVLEHDERPPAAP